MADQLTAHIATAVEIKRQMDAAILYIDEQGRCSGLYANLGDPVSFLKEQADITKVLERQYAPVIGKIVSATTHDDLVERRLTLHNRLSKGWTVCSLNPADTEAHDLWEALLVEYTVIEDALNHADITSAIMQRISQIESFVEGVAHATV